MYLTLESAAGLAVFIGCVLKGLRWGEAWLVKAVGGEPCCIAIGCGGICTTLPAVCGFMGMDWTLVGAAIGTGLLQLLGYPVLGEIVL